MEAIASRLEAIAIISLIHVWIYVLSTCDVSRSIDLLVQNFRLKMSALNGVDEWPSCCHVHGLSLNHKIRFGKAPSRAFHGDI